MKKLLLVSAILTVTWSIGNTLQTSAYAECIERSWQEIEESLPYEVELTIPYPWYGVTYPYLGIEISNGGILNGQHLAWCLDVYEDVIVNNTLKASVYLFLNPEIDWLLNNQMYYVDELSGDGVTYYVPGDIQAAIWLLLDGMPPYQRPDPDGYPDTNPWSKYAWGLPNWGDWVDHDGLNDYGVDAGGYGGGVGGVDNYDENEYNADLIRAMEIAADAQLYGDGYVPGCDDVTGVVLIPYYDLTEDIQIVAQPLLITVQGPCYCIGCRLTGGGNDKNVAWGENTKPTASSTSETNNSVTFGGQAGANTALPPQPKGEWTHTQKSGPSGKFTFHAGTASAPEGTEIIEIRCSDPGTCTPSGDPPSPAKQLDFDGIGTFKNIGSGKWAPVWPAGANVMLDEKGKDMQGFTGTFHYFQVNVDDNGEPGNQMKGMSDGACPPDGFGENPVGGFNPDSANCDCPDFYRITIYDGVTDPSSLNTTDVIYEFHGYLDGGNLQIHYLTGYDLNNMVSLNDLASRWLEGA